jgi:hypothetical protein
MRIPTINVVFCPEESKPWFIGKEKKNEKSLKSLLRMEGMRSQTTSSVAQGKSH